MDYIKLYDVKKLSREEWLDKRREGIGGSDMAAICGISKYQDAFSIYLQKIEPQNTKDIDNPRMRAGRDLESYVATRFEEETGKKTKKCNYVLASKETPYMFANVDRLIVKEAAGLEIKTTTNNDNEWTYTKIPDYYMTQIQHYMYVTGYKKWYCAVLINGWEFRWYEIDRDEIVISNMLIHAKNFWENHVMRQAPPLIGSSKASKDYLKETFNDPQSTEINLLDSNGAIESFNYANEQIKYWEDKKEEAENQILNELGNNEIGYYKNYKITYKQSAGRKSFDRKKFDLDYPEVYETYTTIGNPSRRFLMKEIKK